MSALKLEWDWDSVEVSEREEYKRLVPGGYVCRITKAEDHPDNKYVYFEYDIAEGEYKGNGMNCLERNGFNPLNFRQYYTPKAAQMFKLFINRINDSNHGTAFDAKKDDVSKLVGKVVGMVLGEQEYRNKNGEVKTRFKVARTMTPDEIHAGKFKVPEKELLKEEAPAAPVWSAVADTDDDQLPF